MPRVFDNLSPGTRLLPALRSTLSSASRADFCVGYFNLRGWRHLAPVVDGWGSDAGPGRVLIGMQGLPHEELRGALSLSGGLRMAKRSARAPESESSPRRGGARPR